MNERKNIKELLENIERIDQYLTEKVEWKRNLNSLLRKFNYNPDKGTIKYRGNEYYVSINRNGSTSAITIPHSDPDKSAKKGSIAEITTIHINPDDFRNKSIDTVESIILHEIGHAKVNYNTKTLDPSTLKTNEKHEFKYSKNEDDNIFTKYANRNDSEKDTINFKLIKLLDRYNNGAKLSEKDIEILKKYDLIGAEISDTGKAEIERNKFANATENIADQRSKKQNPHANQREFEADRYAAYHLEHGNNRVSKFIKKSYDARNNKLKDIITSDVISSNNKYDKYNKLKELEDKKRTIENGNARNKQDALKEIENNINKLKVDKGTMKQSKEIRDSLKNPNSSLSKSIQKISDINKKNNENDISSREKALQTSKYSDTKSFTTIDEDDGSNDKNNKPKNINGKSSQRNMMSSKQRKRHI